MSKATFRAVTFRPGTFRSGTFQGGNYYYLPPEGSWVEEGRGRVYSEKLRGRVWIVPRKTEERDET